MTKHQNSLPTWPVEDIEKTRDWMISAWIIPFNLLTAGWDSWCKLNEGWCKTVFRPAAFHDHETHGQLEVPDPIRDNGEHDLFA